MDQRRQPRHRPLETFVSTILSMLHVLYARTQTKKNLKKLASSSYLVKKIFQLVIFFASMTIPFHRYFLAVLSIADDHILAVQDAVETYFPSSTFLFLKLSGLLIITESLPQKLDGFLENLPSLMNRATWLDWILIHAISWLDALVNVLGRWRDKNKGTKEKEITVDRSFSRTGSISEEEEEEEEKRRLGAAERKRATYKEALQRGSSGEDAGEGSSGGGSSRGDPILELFENGWIQNPIKRSSRSADSLTFSRSDSYST